MITYGISKSGKHSYNDFGLWITKKNIGNPSKNKITASVPYMNGSYDFSNLYGEATYGERVLEYTFEIIENSKEELNIKKMKALEWLLSSNEKTQLYDDGIPGFYFMAECIETSFSEKGLKGELKAKFNAEPFKICNHIEGSNLWDDYSILDIFQETNFEVEGTLDINIVNDSIHSVIPEIVSDSDFTIIKDSITYSIKKGTVKESLFTFKPGVNELSISGEGNIEFRFRKEVI